MIVDPWGGTIYKSKEEFVYTTTLEKKNLDEIRAKIPFLKDGDSFLIV
jgi:predicted amidohydrolase